MSLITPADVRALNADGGLSDSALQALIDREETELIRRFGAHTGSRAEIVRGGLPSLYLSRPVETVTSVVESLYLGDANPQTLAATDYYIWSEQGRLQRINTGRVWGAVVTVTYTPQDQTALRTQVLIELVRIASAQDTGGSVSGLGYSISGAGSTQAWECARQLQYNRLGWLTT